MTDAPAKLVNRRIALTHAYREVYETPAGAMMIEDLFHESGLLSVGTVPGDACMSAFNDGKRALGLVIIDRLRWSEGELLKLAERQTAETIRRSEDE